MDGLDPVTLVIAGVLALVLAVIVRSFLRAPRREKLGLGVGVAVYVLVNALFLALPGTQRDAPTRLVAAVVAVAVAADLLRQVPRRRPAPRSAAIAVVGWGVAVFVVTPLAVALYVGRRVMLLPVFPRARISR